MKKVLLFILLLFISITTNAQFIESQKSQIEQIYRGKSYGWSIYKHTFHNPTTIKYSYYFKDMRYSVLNIYTQLQFENLQEFQDFILACDRCIKNKELQLTNKETSTEFQYTIYEFSNLGTKNIKILLYTNNGIKEGWIQYIDIKALKKYLKHDSYYYW